MYVFQAYMVVLVAFFFLALSSSDTQKYINKGSILVLHRFANHIHWICPMMDQSGTHQKIRCVSSFLETTALVL